MRLDGIGLLVKDMGTMIRFYRDVLGFEIKEAEDADNVYLVKDGTLFLLYGRKDFETMTHRTYEYVTGVNGHFEIALYVNTFDEVDAGVSGRAAQKVAEKLLQVSQGRQVLCVTHLPQIAALADHHLLISKSQSGERTYTHVDPLDRRGRIKELARMIGGAQITETTLRSAEEMLQS